MFATWPMVVGALIAGFIAGFLIPDSTLKPSASSTVAAKTGTEKSEQKRTLPPATTASVPAPAKSEASIAKTEPAAPQQNASSGNEDCERQTWPYLSPNCLDRSAQAATPDVVVKTKRAEPQPETNAEAKAPNAEAKAPAAQQASQPPAPPKASEAKVEASAPKAESAAKTAATTPAATESTEKQQPVQAAPPAEKSARRPATRPRTAERTERAETFEEPLRPRSERYRVERRYAGQLEDDDRPVYIERGGRLYLAPEYQHRLRGPDRYWRE